MSQPLPLDEAIQALRRDPTHPVLVKVDDALTVEVLERFAAGVRVLPFDLALATRYATVRAALERKGRPTTDFDLVIACTAIEHGAVLVTNDAALKDGAIEGLVVEDWLGLGYAGRHAEMSGGKQGFESCVGRAASDRPTLA